MREIKNVQGTMQEVKEVEFNVDTVYVRTNVVRIENENFKGWQYDEIQYTYQEWADVQQNKISNLEKDNANILMENAEKDIKIGNIEKEMSNIFLGVAGGALNG